MLRVSTRRYFTPQEIGSNAADA
eukprot:COSAG02_NODE_16846_length_1051_cov_1.153361_1_plen_22_part_01